MTRSDYSDYGDYGDYDRGQRLSTMGRLATMEQAGDYQTYKLCPILSAEFGGDRLCEGPCCAWYDLRRECCAVLSIARQPEKDK